MPVKSQEAGRLKKLQIKQKTKKTPHSHTWKQEREILKVTKEVKQII